MTLQEGDEVAIVAPAAGMRSADESRVDNAADLLRSWGLRPRLSIEDRNYFYLAGTDEQRARHLAEAVSAPEIKAVFCTRGGYGSPRLLPRMTWASPSPKLLVGFSDITALHLAVITAQQQATAGGDTGAHNIWPVHGPNVATAQFLDRSDDAQANRDDLRRLLFEPEPTAHRLRFLRAGVASGPLIGGCLSLVSSLVGTPFLPDLGGSILFLEDVGERPYSIDRMLFQLRNAGALDHVAGFVFGAMHDCTDGLNSLEDVIGDVLDPYDVPIAFGLPSGHGSRNSAIPLGPQAKLDSTTGSLQIPGWS